MFLSLANAIGAQRVLALDAPTASFLMEAAWSRGGQGLLRGVPRSAPAPIGATFPAFRLAATWSTAWDHLIYAYMVENTRIYEILGRVIGEYAQGERLGIPSNNRTFQWLRTTEELFYKDASPNQPFNLVSRVRPDIAATRRNAYFRMFGMDLNHGRDGGASYPYVRPDTANREFVNTMEEFLRQVWVAISNRQNFSGTNPTDISAIVDLAVRLENMLTGRRGGAVTRPNLAREEFLAVSLASWLALTVSFDSAIVQDLVATGPSPEERLRRIGERVGIPSHGLSHSYFRIAGPVSTLLRALEQGVFSNPAGAGNLAGLPTTRQLVSTVIHHWSLISGRDLRAGRIAVVPSLQAASSATPPMTGTQPMVPVAASGGNGKVPVGAS